MSRAWHHATAFVSWKLLGRKPFGCLTNYLMCIRSDNNLRHAGWILLQHLQHCPLDKLKHQKQFSPSFEKLQQLIIGIFMGLWKVKIFVKIDSHHWTMFSWRRLRSTRSSRMVVRLTSSLSSESLNFLIATISPVSEKGVEIFSRQHFVVPRFRAFQTMPYAPSPTVSSISYLSRRVGLVVN